MIRHRLKSPAGSFAGFKMGVAYCGASRETGAEFTSCSRLITCPECKRLIGIKQAAAKARFAAIQQRRTA